jgi:hypothetical protein
MTTVNVDPETAKTERASLLVIANKNDVILKKQGKRCLICSGHGAISILNGNNLIVYREVTHLTNS